MTAKELKEKAQIIHKPNELKKPQYLFTEEGFIVFCQQLCKEQRKSCHDSYFSWQDYKEQCQEVLNAPMPEL